MSVGEGGGGPVTPTSSMAALVNERFRAQINDIVLDPDTPDLFTAELFIPQAEGGWYIREVGLWMYNTPPAEVRETWRLVGGAASLGWFLAHLVFDTEPEDSGLYGAARAVQDATGELFAMLHSGFPCADHVRRALHAALMGEVAEYGLRAVPPTSAMSET